MKASAGYGSRLPFYRSRNTSEAAWAATGFSAGMPNGELYRARACRLVDLFPDELVIQERTVSVIRNEPFVSYVQTMPVHDIGRVVYVDVPFLAGIHIVGKNTSHDLGIKGLYKRQAQEAKQILENLLLESSNNGSRTEWLHPDVDHGRPAKKEVHGAM